MSWNTLSEFFNMGGYALYVWNSYLFTFILIVLEIGIIFRRTRSQKKLSDSGVFKSEDTFEA